jgi:hypothetical protein
MVTPENVITISLAQVEQLFNTMDPSPFHERDLDDKAEQYIVGYAREMPRGQPFRLIVNVPQIELTTPAAAHVPEAIRSYFGYRALQSGQDLNELLRIGWRSMMIGLTVLGLCLFGVNFISADAMVSGVERFFVESLIIFGWVANWRPIEIFLYDWWPIRRHIRLLRRLSVMPVELRGV